MKKNLFRTADGRNHLMTFLLICSLFLLWGFCNGMIDVLNKHFQNSLGINKTQSAFVQMANYMAYFLMAIPAGLLAKRFGYKGGILIGLILIATGAFWFIPATLYWGKYWAFLTGLFILATGLTCLETIANPYATVLGSPELGATRINLAQSVNGIGWILGPMVGGSFILSSTGEINRSNDTLYQPYLIVGIVVTILIVCFAFSKLPDLKNEDPAETQVKETKGVSKPMFKRWHFVFAIAAQFFYVAAQTGIFSFFINYIVSDTPVMSQKMASAIPASITYSAAMFSASEIKDITAFAQRLQADNDAKTKPVSEFIWSRLSTNFTAAYNDKTETDMKVLHKKQIEAMETDLNRLLQTNTLYTAERFAGLTLSPLTKQLLSGKIEGEALARLNRSLIETVYPDSLIQRSPYLEDSKFRVTEKGASVLLSGVGFVLFLLGRFFGSAVLGVCKAHTTLAAFSAVAAFSMVLVVMGLGWISVFGLFLSFFCMSIMFPTIFALGIHGLGEQTKLGSSLIVMAIVGGAIMPLLMGKIADDYSMRVGFVVPLGCFILVMLYGLSWRVLRGGDAAESGPISVTARH
jgi:fucose permease